MWPPPGILGLELTGEDQQDGRAGKATSWTARLGLLRKVDLRTLLLPSEFSAQCLPHGRH